ncbi:MAG: hypothetical protein CMI74_07160 [Candidatus Pelagibacter sp.]|jgi:hypothetical protein|nr:hypothetical protein [Candidatus Pelagibacter sp.]|tara:strand:+ start:7430 stop:8209 length:780 start_codon:yes stop_codon:yes gene_type:complete
MDTQVAQKKTTEVVVSELDKLLEEDSGAGLENFTTEDMQIPFIRILQALSPQLNKQDPLYIKGAEQGDIFNTVSGEIYKADTGLTVVPAYFEKKFLEFALRSTGGGFIKELSPDDKDINLTNREGTIEMLPSGNELVRTHQHLVIAKGENEMAPAVLDMKKTQLKVSRRWNTLKNGIRLPSGKPMPLYGTAWKITTVSESNDQGTWYNYKLDRITEITKDIESMMLEARNMYQSVRKGEVKMAAASADEMADKGDEAPF